MTAQELLARQISRQTKNLLDAAKAFPEEKLNWKPTENTRSALDQLQECATACSFWFELYTDRKMHNMEERYPQWMEARAALVTLPQIEEALQAASQQLIDFTLSCPTEALADNVELPWPVENNLADMIHFHTWNMSYHEGQINLLKFLLEAQS